MDTNNTATEYFVNARGFMVFAPEKPAAGADIETKIEYIRARHEYNTTRTETANAAFNQAFVAAMGR